MHGEAPAFPIPADYDPFGPPSDEELAEIEARERFDAELREYEARHRQITERLSDIGLHDLKLFLYETGEAQAAKKAEILEQREQIVREMGDRQEARREEWLRAGGSSAAMQAAEREYATLVGRELARARLDAERAEEAAAGGAEAFPRLDLAALLDPNRPRREWVCEGLVPVGASVSFVAAAGSMKSLLVLALCVALARGDSHFAGLRLPRPRRVLYLDMENTEDDLAERLRSLDVRPGELEQLVFLHLPSIEPLDTPAGAAQLASLLDAYEIAAGDVVVLDSLQRLVAGPENDSDTYRAFYRLTALVLKQRGVAVIRTDNTGKDTKAGARGSSSKKDDVDLELLVQRTGDSLSVTQGKSRLPNVVPMVFQLHTDDEGHIDFSAAGDPFEAQVQAVLDDLRALGVPLTASQRAVERALREAGKVHRRAAVRAAVTSRAGAPGDFGAPELEDDIDSAPSDPGAPRRTSAA